MKIILTVILSFCWKLQNVPLPINGYFKSQITSRKIAGSAYGKHILTSDNSSSQHNTKPHSWWKHGSLLPGKSALGCWGRGMASRGNPVAMSRDGRKWQRWMTGDNQSNINALSAVLSREIKITWAVTGEKSLAKTYILPKPLKPKYWLI